MSLDIQLLLYKRTVIPSVIYNLEMWTKLRKRDWEQLERIQGMVMRRILALPNSTPYWGMLKELGIWPLKDKVIERRLNVYYDIMTGDENRMCKRIIESQRKNEIEGWYTEVEEDAKKRGI